MAARLARIVLALTALLAVAALACVAAPQARAVSPNTYFFMNSIGGPGTGPGTFGNNTSPGPYAVATDAAGNVYAVDPYGTALIQKFDPSGTLICSFGTGIVGSCFGIAVGPSGVVYVIDTGRSDSNRIQEFSSTNGVNYVSAGHIACPEVAASEAYHLAVDLAGNVYVTGWTGTSGYLLKYGPAGGTPVTIGAGVLSGPTAVAVDAVGDVYVSDNGHLMKFHSADGGATYANVANWTNSGTGTFLNLGGVAIDSSGNIFVVDEDFNLVTELSAAGTPLQSWGGLGSDNYSFHHTYGIAVSPGGAVYVADAGVGTLGSTVNHRIMRYARDATAPVTTATVTPSAWTSAASVNVSLSASDPTVFDQYHSGLASVSPTQISLNGGSTWQDYAGPISVTTEGQTSIMYRSTDAVGNVETPKTAVVRIDRTPPTTGVSGIPTGWSKTAVTATLTATDALSGPGPTEYSLNGGATWTTGTRPAISAQGITTLLYRSRDTVGNLEAAKSATVRIDGVRPATKAFANVTVKRGKTAKLRYRVSDVPGAQAQVTIKIYNGAGKLRAKWTVGLVTANKILTHSHHCTLAKGIYTWKVYATDLAGNVQVTPAGKKLIVK